MGQSLTRHVWEQFVTRDSAGYDKDRSLVENRGHEKLRYIDPNLP